MCNRNAPRKKEKRQHFKDILKQLPTAIVYLSDAFIFLIVITWIFYIVNGVFGAWYELINIKTTTIFTDLKDACTIPLTAGGVAWLIRTAANHLSAGLKGHRLSFDFPNVDEDGNIVNSYEDNDMGLSEREAAEAEETEDSNTDETNEDTIIDGGVAEDE